MPNLSQQSQAIITAFGGQPGVTQDQINNLQAVITASPALIDQINSAVAQGHLRQIMPLTNPNAGGEYAAQSKEMRLPLAALTTPSPGSKPFDAGEVAFVLGHELEHGFNHAATQQAYRDFHRDADLKAKETGTPRDYSTVAGTLIAANRDDEAGAEIAGWNAVVGMVKSTNPNPTLEDIYKKQPQRLRDFISQSGSYPNYTYTLKPNLTLNPDLTLSDTAKNIEAMGQNFFDKVPKQTRLGALGNSDYANYYAAWAIGEIAKLERQHHPPQPGVTTPQMALSLTQLHLNEKLLEENGIDLGVNAQPMPYYDASTQPPVAGLFQHTVQTHQHVSPMSVQAFEAEIARSPINDVGQQALHLSGPGHPDHPDHAMLEQIRAGVRAIDTQHGRSYDDTSERISRGLLVACKDHRGMYPDSPSLISQTALRSVDHVLLTESHMIAIEGKLEDPAQNRAAVKVDQVVRMSVEQSDRKLEAANTLIEQERGQSSQQALAHGLDDPTLRAQSMPGMSL